jgi:hypothetical protein
MKNNMDQLGALWLSRSKETIAGTYQTSNLMRQAWAAGSRMSLERARSDNRQKMTGTEIPTGIIELNRRAKGSISMDEAMVDFITFILAFFYGACANTAPGALAKCHTITPLSDLEMPTFSVYQKHGNKIFFEKFAGCGLNSFDIEIKNNSWVRASCDIAGWGKSNVDYLKNTGTITNPYDGTLQLNEYIPPADGQTRGEGGTTSDVVAGATETERIANIYKLEISTANGWQEAVVTGCTGGAKSTITFTGVLGLTGGEAYRLYYISAQSDSWKTIPSITQESPLKISQATLLVNATYDGDFSGGSSSIDLHWTDLTIHGDNNLLLRDIPGTGKIYASDLRRGQRLLTIKLSKYMRETILNADLDANDTLSLQIYIQGAEFEATYNYSICLMFPLIGIVGLNIGSNEQLLTEEGDLLVLSDATYDIGKIITYNKTTTYIA